VTIIDSVGSGGEWERYECAADLVEVRDSNPLDWENRSQLLIDIVERWFINWVPRAFWDGKPQTDWTAITSDEVYGHLYTQSNWTRNFTVLGQGYYLGGMVGVGLIGILYGATISFALSIGSRRSAYAGARAFVILYGLFSLGNNFTSLLFYITSYILITSIIVRLVYPLPVSAQRR